MGAARVARALAGPASGARGRDAVRGARLFARRHGRAARARVRLEPRGDHRGSVHHLADRILGGAAVGLCDRSLGSAPDRARRGRAVLRRARAALRRKRQRRRLVAVVGAARRRQHVHPADRLDRGDQQPLLAEPRHGARSRAVRHRDRRCDRADPHRRARQPPGLARSLRQPRRDLLRGRIPAGADLFSRRARPVAGAARRRCRRIA